MSERRKFRACGGRADFQDLAPMLFDRTSSSQTGGGHYFYQDVWALRHLAQVRPAEHHDVGSRLDGFVAQATSICPVIYWDIRAPAVALPDFQFRYGTILHLPLPDESVQSLSCLHVVEHIGLGRYGDVVDPLGAEKALKELQRVLARGGQLLVSMPVGRERVEFNAQRIWDPEKPLHILSSLELVDFKAVDDQGSFQEEVQPCNFSASKYACGLYCFKRTR